MLYIPRWQKFLVAVFVALMFWAALPSLLPEKSRQELSALLPPTGLVLGLDLQGGGHLVYQAQMDTYFSEALSELRRDVRKILRPQGWDKDGVELLSYKRLQLQDQKVVVTFSDQESAEKGFARIQELQRPVDEGFLSSSMAARFIIERDDTMSVTIAFSPDEMAARKKQVMQQVIEVIRRRIDAFGTREPTIIPQGENQVVVQIPGEVDVRRIKNEVGRVARLTFHMVDETASAEQLLSGFVPSGRRVLPLAEYEGQLIAVHRDSVLSGEHLVSASSSQDNMGQFVVNFRFDGVGAARFGQITQNNIGKPFAIVLDDEVISAPIIQSAILGGDGMISGNFTRETAGNLALLLQSGALPVPLTVIEERTIGSQLGASSIEAGLKALIVAFGLVTGFMCLYYGRFGVYASIALLVNVIAIVGSLSILGATLTLPGVAGIVLGIGIAVDANVLINERIREELRMGGDNASVILAIDRGYSDAYNTIFDSHLTTIIGALAMFFLGIGPIRGFAVTFLLGTLASILGSVWITRLFISNWAYRVRPQKVRFGLIDFLTKRNCATRKVV